MPLADAYTEFAYATDWTPSTRAWMKSSERYTAGVKNRALRSFALDSR
jgi:hypothetical protein